MKKLFICILMLTASLFLLAGCFGGNSGQTSYKLSFNCGGGSEITAITKTDGTILNLSDYETTKNGYTFLGWAENSSSSEFKKSGTIALNKNLTLYAGWEIIIYTVSYDLQGGRRTGQEDFSVTYTIEEDEISLGKPIRAGYTFKNWKIGNSIVEEDILGAVYLSNLEVIAEWEEGQYINTLDDLKMIKENLAGKYYLTGDINLNNEEWEPIGGETGFSGIFEGNGNIIKNFKITGSRRYGAFFGSSSGTIKNLGLTEFSININYSSSAFNLLVGGLCGLNKGTIENTFATGSINAEYTSSNFTAGGTLYAGGLVGCNEDSNAKIINSYATGNVTAVKHGNYGDVMAGGLVGMNRRVYTIPLISSCFSSGNVSASVTGQYSYAYAGGIVGSNGPSSFMLGSVNNSFYSQNSVITGTTTKSEGIATSIENLKSKSWLAALGFSESIWNLNILNGTAFPQLIKTNAV